MDNKDINKDINKETNDKNAIEIETEKVEVTKRENKNTSVAGEDISIIKPELSYDELVQKSKDEMNFKQRVVYFWEYHKWKVIIPLAIVVFLVLTIRGYLEEIRPTDLNVKVINCNDDKSVEDYVEAYSDELLANKTIELGISYEGFFIHPEVVDEYTGANSSVASSMQKYQSGVIAGDMDVTIATDWVFEEYGKNNVYMDLSKELPKDLYEELKDDFVYATLETGEKIPVAVYVDESKVLKDAFGENRPVLGIFVRSEKKENAVAFLRYVIGE